MLYFKHSDLVNKYHVSLKTVHNWIDAAKTRKIDLQLFSLDGRTYVSNTSSNTAILKQLAEQGKKYRNVRYRKVITPTDEFYDLFSRRQILDIISNLTIHREIPRQYNYFNGGAHNWDSYVIRQSNDEGANSFKNTIELLHTNLESIDQLTHKFKKINVLDVGAGNAMPVRELLEHLLERGTLHRYIAVDISQSMLDIAEVNVAKWFNGRVKYEGHLRDVTYERFDDLVIDDMLAKDADNTLNLVLLLGGTPLNFRDFNDALRVIYGSMGNNDTLIYTGKPDTEEARRFFDFHAGPKTEGLSPNHRLILDLLNIDMSLYDVEMGFSKEKRMRYIRIRLKTSLTINFQFSDGTRNVDLEKGDTILLLRVWHMTALETISEFERAGFVLLQSNMTKDRGRLMTILGIDNRSTVDGE